MYVLVNGRIFDILILVGRQQARRVDQLCGRGHLLQEVWPQAGSWLPPEGHWHLHRKRQVSFQIIEKMK